MAGEANGSRVESRYDALMIGALLYLPIRVIERRVAQALLAHGFTDYRPTHQVVFQFCRPEGSRLTELAERAGVTKQTMSETVAYLVEHGYLERRPDPTDRRAVLFRRTERGWDVSRVARQVVEELQDEWTHALGAGEFGLLLRQLRRLARHLDEPAGPAGTPEAAGPPQTGQTGHASPASPQSA